MTSFATPAELASWLQVPQVDTASALLQLAVASQVIRDYCGWSITAETVTGAVVDTAGDRSLWLPTLYLTDVASITENGVALQVTHYEWRRHGRVMRLGRHWPNAARVVEVTYTHGYPAVPDSVKGVCLAVAGRAYRNPAGLKTQVAGPFTESFVTSADGSVAALTSSEMAQLGPYKLEFVG